MDKIKELSTVDQVMRYIKKQRNVGASSLMLTSGGSPTISIGGKTIEDKKSRIGISLSGKSHRHVIDAFIETAIGSERIIVSDTKKDISSIIVNNATLGKLRASALRGYDRQFSALRIHFY